MMRDIAVSLMTGSLFAILIGMTLGGLTGKGLPGWSLMVMLVLWALGLVAGIISTVSIQ